MVCLMRAQEADARHFPPPETNMGTHANRPLTHTLTAAVFSLALLGCPAGDDSAADTAAGDTATPAAATAEQMDDRVERALETDSALQAFGLDADDDNGRIVLKGRVRTAAQQALALQVANREAGGVAVDNRIRIDSTIRADRARPVDVDELEERIEDAIEDDSTFRGLDVDVEEDDGQLVLEGRVRTAAQKTAAETLAKGMAGTVAVVNRLRVEP